MVVTKAIGSICILIATLLLCGTVPALADDGDPQAGPRELLLPPPSKSNLLVVVPGALRYTELKGQGYRCLRSIQAAVDAALEGDLIFITDGTYREELIIEGKRDLTLKGEGGVTIVGQHDHDVVFIKESRGIRVTNLATVHELGESPCLHNCFVVWDARNVRIDHCDISGCGYIGVEVLGNGQPRNIRVNYCYIHDCEVAFYDVNGDALIRRRNVLENNTEEAWTL